MAQITALRRRVIDDMMVRNYVYAVAKFSRFFGCSPDRLGIEEVRAYQLHLAGLLRDCSLRGLRSGVHGQQILAVARDQF
jgi:hypothetical protein